MIYTCIVYLHRAMSSRSQSRGGQSRGGQSRGRTPEKIWAICTQICISNGKSPEHTTKSIQHAKEVFDPTNQTPSQQDEFDRIEKSLSKLRGSQKAVLEQMRKENVPMPYIIATLYATRPPCNNMVVHRWRKARGLHVKCEEECKFGDSCGFSHEEGWIDHALRKYKTQTCKDYENGTCLRGTTCSFAHGQPGLPIAEPSVAAATSMEKPSTPVATFMEEPVLSVERPVAAMVPPA